MGKVEWRGPRPPEDVDSFTPAELRAILTAAHDVDHDLAVMLRLWAQSGMREGEVFGLHPEDLDLERGTVLVRRTLSRGRVGPTKTGRERQVSFLHPVAEVTPEWRPGATPGSRHVLDGLRRLQVQPADPTSYLFTHDGEPWSNRNLIHAWHRVLTKAHVRYRNPEQLRHTLASTLLSRNAPLLYVQQQGGWRSAAVLLRVYARWLPQHVGTVAPAQPSASPAQPAGKGR
jgi:integrase